MEKIYLLLRNNKIIFFILIVYALTMFSIIGWGIPNNNHPFPYHMDEWHQLSAVRALFKYGTPNIEGAAHGSILFFFISGFYLMPFFIFSIVNPFTITSSVGSLDTQHTLFQILRLETLLFGIGSIIILGIILKKVHGFGEKLAVAFFTFTPLWLSLSNYFKYDIVLIFFLLLSLFFMLRYSKNSAIHNFLLAAVSSGFAIAIKISAVPIILLYVSSFFLFHKKKNQWQVLIYGILLLMVVAFFVGMPDVLLGKAKGYDNFLSSNIISNWDSSLYQVSNSSILKSILIDQFPLIFGHGLFVLGIISLFYLTIHSSMSFLRTRKIIDRYVVFYLFGFYFFAASLIPLRMWAGGNRALVLLPFIIILSALFIQKIKKSLQGVYKLLAYLLLGILVFVQVAESYIWVQLKWQESPQQKASLWIQENLKRGSVIGIENIPIYQQIPEIILKEFYGKNEKENRYLYEVVDNTTKQFPEYIILTNTNVIPSYYTSNSKRELLNHVIDQQYKKISEFTMDFSYYELLNSPYNYYLSGLVAAPANITVYKK